MAEMNEQIQPRTVSVNGVELSDKWCHTCKIYKGIRTTHCSLCDNCVHRFDHHCVWIGNCVGLRNYGYFLWFVTSTTLLLLYVFATSLAQIVVLVLRADSLTDTLVVSPPNTILPACLFMLYAMVLFFPLTGLATYHWYISSRELNTYEDIKERFSVLSVSFLNPTNRLEEDTVLSRLGQQSPSQAIPAVLSTLHPT